MARRTLGLGTDVPPRVTGGLTFFGAPLNTSSMTGNLLRDGAKPAQWRGSRALYGQGGFVTKNHGLVLSREAPKQA